MGKGGIMNDRRPVGMILHEEADRMYVICSDGTAYSAKVGSPGIVMGWHEIDPIPGTPATCNRSSTARWIWEAVR